MMTLCLNLLLRIYPYHNLKQVTCAEVSSELHDESGKCDVPAAALDALENFSVLE